VLAEQVAQQPDAPFLISVFEDSPANGDQGQEGE
jgi:hypothetical protein